MNHNLCKAIFLCVFLAGVHFINAQQTVALHTSTLTAQPERGLERHSFLYCGEWQNKSIERQTMYIVRGGKVVWSYTNPHKGELGDCTMLSNGNVVFSRQYGASEVTPDKKIVWALQDWKDLGPASSTQLLDEPGVPENGDLQR